MSFNKISYKKLIPVLLFLIIVDIILIKIDKTCSLLYFNNYFDIISVIYQVQSAIVAFSVLGLSLFSNSLDYKVYGVPFKEIITRKRFLWLNYWEAIILSIVLLPINMLGIVCASMTSVITFFIFDFAIILFLLMKTIDIIVDSEKNETICKDLFREAINSNEFVCIKEDLYLDNLGKDIKASIKTDDGTYAKKIDFVLELYQDSFTKNSKYLYWIQDIVVKIFIELVNESDEEAAKKFFEQSYDMFVELSITDENKMNIANSLIPTMLNEFSNAVYSESYSNLNAVKIKMAICDTLRDYFHNKNLEAAVDYLLLYSQKIIYNRDKKMYDYLISKLYEIGNEQKYSKVLYVINIYIYYLCFYYKGIGNEVDELNIAELRKIITGSHNYGMNNIHKYIAYYQDNIFEHISFIKSKMSLPFWKSYYQSGTNSADIQYAMYEFLAFIGQNCYPNNSYSGILFRLEIGDLSQIYNLFDVTNKTISDDLDQEFKDFLLWTNIKERLPRTNDFFLDLSRAIFYQLQNKYIAIRSNKNTKYYEDIETSIRSELDRHPFLIEVNDNYESIQISRNLLLNDCFTEKWAIRKEIEEKIIKQNRKCFKTIDVWFADKLIQKSINKVLRNLHLFSKNGINIDKYINHLISDNKVIFYKIDSKKSQQFIDFEKNLQKMGELKYKNYPLYFDSAKMDFGFSIDAIFFSDTIGEKDIREILSHLPRETNFVKINDAGINYYLDEENAIEYIKLAYFKIVVKIRIQKGDNKCGLILQ